MKLILSREELNYLVLCYIVYAKYFSIYIFKEILFDPPTRIRFLYLWMLFLYSKVKSIHPLSYFWRTNPWSMALYHLLSTTYIFICSIIYQFFAFRIGIPFNSYTIKRKKGFVFLMNIENNDFSVLSSNVLHLSNVFTLTSIRNPFHILLRKQKVLKWIIFAQK